VIEKRAFIKTTIIISNTVFKNYKNIMHSSTVTECYEADFTAQVVAFPSTPAVAERNRF
jgi:hypothetical protein